MATESAGDFNAVIAALFAELRTSERRRDDQRAISAIVLAVAALETTANFAVLDQSSRAVEVVSKAWGVFIPHVNPSPLTISQHDLLVAQSRTWGTQIRERAGIVTEETGLGMAQAITAETTKSGIKILRNAFEFAGLKSIHREVHESGRGIFSLKVAVPVLDRDTTDLCRNRMGYQVRAWDDYFVDPRSGARWLFPPFVGAGLSRREAWHPCRTIAVPRQ